MGIKHTAECDRCPAVGFMEASFLPPGWQHWIREDRLEEWDSAERGAVLFCPTCVKKWREFLSMVGDDSRLNALRVLSRAKKWLPENVAIIEEVSAILAAPSY